MMTATPTLDHLDAQQLRELATRLMAEMRFKQVLIDKLTHEMATLKRLKFAAASEAYTGERQQLLFETIETNLEALSAEIETLAPTVPVEREKQQPKRAALPASLPRRDVHHEPDSTTCSCGCQLCSCSRWWTRLGKNHWRSRRCMPMRRRWQCSSPAMARHIGPICGVTAAPCGTR